MNDRTLCDISEGTMAQIFTQGLKPNDPTMPYRYFACRDTELFYFSGATSCFTPSCQDGINIEINGKSYPSIDSYMWEMKFIELTGQLPKTGKLRGEIRRIGVTDSDIEKWVLTRGLLHLQKAILTKIKMDISFQQSLMGTGNKLILYTYNKDNFFATGKPMNEMREWFELIRECNLHMKMPLRFPLHREDLSCAPILPENGHNVLGLIYMALREAIVTRGLHSLEVKIPELDFNEISDCIRVAASIYSQNSKNRREINWNKNNSCSTQQHFQPYPGISPIQLPIKGETGSNQTLTRYAQSEASSRNNLHGTTSQMSEFAQSRANTLTPNTGFGDMQLNSRQQRHLSKVLKQETEKGYSYSNMPTPFASSIASSQFNVGNWQSPNQLSIVERATARLREQQSEGGNTPTSDIREQQRLAVNALGDEAFVAMLERSEQVSNQEPTMSQNFFNYRPIKREMEEDDTDSCTSSKRKA